MVYAYEKNPLSNCGKLVSFQKNAQNGRGNAKTVDWRLVKTAGIALNESFQAIPVKEGSHGCFIRVSSKL